MTELALDKIEVTTVGNFLDLWATSRAVARTFAAGAWMWLAVVYGNGLEWLWGVPLVVSSAVSWLHTWGDGESFWNRINERTVGQLPVPRPVDLLGVIELVGVLAAGAATGHWVGIFHRPDAALLATGLVFVSALPGLSNVVAHRSHVGFRGTTEFGLWRRSGAVAAGVGLGVLLWPSEVTAPSVAAVLLGSVFVTASAWHSAYQLDRIVALTEPALKAAFAMAVEDMNKQFHGTLRNPARGAVNAVQAEIEAASSLRKRLKALGLEDHPEVTEWTRASDIARQRTVSVATRVSEYVEATAQGRVHLRRRASDIVAAIIPFHVMDETPYQGVVLRELDPETLDEGDIEVIDVCLNELVTNALTAGAKHMDLEVDVDTRVDLRGTSWVTLRVACSCGKALTSGRPTEGRLGILAGQLNELNGNLEIEDDGDGTHVTTATWPTDATPQHLNGQTTASGRLLLD